MFPPAHLQEEAGDEKEFPPSIPPLPMGVPGIVGLPPPLSRRESRGPSSSRLARLPPPPPPLSAFVDEGEIQALIK